MRKWFGTVIWLGVFAIAAATAAAIYGERHWALGLMAHFRPHLVALGFVWTFLALFQRRAVAVAASAALMALNAAPIVPYVMKQPQETATVATSPLRVMAYNMHGRRTQRTALLDYVQSEQPDVILLTEVPPDYGWLVDSLGADYRHRVDSQTNNPHDLVLFSRWPIRDVTIDRSLTSRFPVIAYDLCQDDANTSACVRLVGLHAIAPFGERVARHDEQLAVAATLAREAPQGQAIVAGDLNTTPWSHRFRRLLSDGGLRNAAIGRSITATWTSRQPVVGLAIDHVLASPRIVVQHYEVGPDLGSDHLPVMAGLSVPQTQPTTVSQPR